MTEPLKDCQFSFGTLEFAIDDGELLIVPAGYTGVVNRILSLYSVNESQQKCNGVIVPVLALQGLNRFDVVGVMQAIDLARLICHTGTGLPIL